jgi:hypothetical protein
MGTKHYMHSVEHLARVLTAPDIVEHMRQGREEKTKHDETCRVDVELRKRVIRTTEELSWAANRALIEQLRKNAGEFMVSLCCVCSVADSGGSQRGEVYRLRIRRRCRIA